MPRMGQATACRKVDVKSLPRNCTVFLIKPQEGISWPSAPLRRGPDGLEIWLQGTMLKVAPVSTKIPIIGQFVSQKNQASVCGKMHSRGSGMCGKSRRTERGSAARNAPVPVRPIGVVIVKFCTCHCQGFEMSENLGGKGGYFWGGPSPCLRPSYGRQLLLSLSLMAEDGSKTLQEEDRCRVILLEGDVV
jgi:hypothetical protein